MDNKISVRRSRDSGGLGISMGTRAREAAKSRSRARGSSERNFVRIFLSVKAEMFDNANSLSSEKFLKAIFCENSEFTTKISKSS